MRKRTVGIGILAASCVAAIGAFWVVPPLKLAAPTLFGTHCSGRVCTELPEDLPEASALIAAAMADVEAQTGLPLPSLNTVLCRTDVCYRRFGGGDERAISYPFLGAVIAGHSWQSYISRHEMIHWLQFEHFGAIETMKLPIWFREGMAYALSGAPDSDIPEPFKPWTQQYLDWQGERSPTSVFSAQPALD